MITVTCDCCKKVIKTKNTDWAEIKIHSTNFSENLPYELCYDCFLKMRSWLEDNCDN